MNGIARFWWMLPEICFSERGVNGVFQDFGTNSVSAGVKRTGDGYGWSCIFLGQNSEPANLNRWALPLVR